MDNEPTYMDCWLFIAPLIPINTSHSRAVYCMMYQALREAEDRRRETERRKNDD